MTWNIYLGALTQDLKMTQAILFFPWSSPGLAESDKDCYWEALICKNGHPGRSRWYLYCGWSTVLAGCTKEEWIFLVILSRKNVILHLKWKVEWEGIGNGTLSSIKEICIFWEKNNLRSPKGKALWRRVIAGPKMDVWPNAWYFFMYQIKAIESEETF